MRQFETIHNFVDNEGYPISGDRVSFYVNGTQTLASIKDSDGNSLSNPISIVMGHTAKQVFLPDSDIKIVWERCVDSVDDSWESVKSWIDKFNVVPVNVTGGIPIVNTVAEMLALDPSVGVVNLMGYYSAGDKPLVVYRWKSSRHFNADGGAIISNRVDGYWGANFDSDFVDVRHYGVFPQASATETQGVKINQVYNSVKLLGKSLYFPVSEYNTIYEVGGCNISGCKADAGVRFISNGNDSEFRDCTNIYAKAGSGKITIVGDVIKTSQNVDVSDKVSLKPRKTIVLDSAYRSGITWSGVEVNVIADQLNGATFTNCTFSGTGKLKSGTFNFNNCEVKESIFDSSFSLDNVTFSNCISSYIVWTDVSKFLKFCSKNGSKVIDLGGNTSNTVITLPEGCTLKNAKITNAVILSDDVTIDNCDVNLFSSEGVYVDNVTFVNSTVRNNSVFANSLIATNTSFKVLVYAKKVTARNCEFTGLDSYNADIDSCSFSNDITLRPTEAVLKDFSIVGCTFASGKCVKAFSTSSYTISGGMICNNVLLGSERDIIVFENIQPTSYSAMIITNNVNDSVGYVSTNAFTTFNGSLRAREFSAFEKSSLIGLVRLAIDSSSSIFNPSDTVKSSLSEGTIVFETYETGKVGMFIKRSGDWIKIG